MFSFSRRFFAGCFVFIFAVRASFAHTHVLRTTFAFIYVLLSFHVCRRARRRLLCIHFCTLRKYAPTPSIDSTRLEPTDRYTDMPTYGRIPLIRAHRHRARARTMYSNWHSNLLNFCVLCVQKYSLLCLFSNSTRIPYCVTTMRALSAQREL